MQVIRVVAAVIIRRGKIFCAQRHKGGDAGAKWEFPGGKVEDGETDELALKREIGEELKLDIAVGKHITQVLHHYPDSTVEIHFYHAKLVQEKEPVLLEHLSFRWMEAESLEALDWAEADKKALMSVKAYAYKEERDEDC